MYFIIILLFFFTIFNFILLYKNLIIKKQNKNNYINKNNNEIKKLEEKIELEKERLKEQREKTQSTLKLLADQINTARTQWDDEYKQHQFEINNHLLEWEDAERARRILELQNEFNKKKEEEERKFLNQQVNFAQELAQASSKLEQLKEELSDYQKRQQAVNEEIIRRRALEENKEFFSIQLSDEAKEDIKILRSIRFNLHFRENLDKLIYDNYISKPVNELVKRVLNGRAPSGIYKITRLKTGEIYIGKSTDIKARWQQHVKTAFGVGTIAHSILHTTMEKDGVENFTFEMIEEVPKDNLTEREKFYIEFYNSKKYGLNQKAGG